MLDKLDKLEKTVISGPLYKIDMLNKNGWGVSKEEVDNVLNTIIGNPLKICSGVAAITNEHSCDFSWNVKDEIGRVVGAEVKDDWIHATAEVTDPVATRKILDGTWPDSWSGFLTHRAPKSEGFLPSIKNKAVTIVRNPAYENAGYKRVGAGAATESALEAAINKINNKFKGAPMPLKGTTPSERLKEANERSMNKFKGA